MKKYYILFLYIFTVIFANDDSAFAVNAKNKQDRVFFSSSEKQIVKSQKDDSIPDFPQEDVEKYNMLFDDGFANIIDPMFEGGKEWDTFADQKVLDNINRQYMAGNDEFITQMDVIEAEKKTNFDENVANINNITTHRTRIMAYLTIDQMLLADIFNLAPHGYYISTIVSE